MQDFSMQDFYKICALLILIIFYGIYIGKMLAQKKKGIQTDQMAKGKEKGKRFYIEAVTKLSAYSIAPVVFLSISYGKSMLGMEAKTAGIIIGLLGDIIFALAVWTMKDSWRAGIPEHEKTQMVTKGIYRYSRNPAFVGFDLVYLSILLLYFNWILLFFVIWAMLMLHLQILQEEKFLPTVFGKEYEVYEKQTFRYIGRRRKANTP